MRLLGSGGYKSLIAENLFLRQQLLVVGRGRKRGPNLSPWKRLLLGMLSSVVGARRIGRCSVVFKPSTLLQWHEALKRRKYRRLYSATKQGKPGPSGPSKELVEAIIEFKRRNPTIGCPRIAQQLSMTFDVEIDKDVVRRVLATRYHPESRNEGPSWLTFLGHSKDSLWSIDLFRAESITVKS